MLTPAIRDRLKRIGPLLAAISLLALTCAASAGAFPTEVTYHYRSGDPQAKLQRGLIAFSFSAATVNGKAKEVVPEEFSGFPSFTEPLQKAAFGITAELTCEQEGVETAALAGFFVQLGKAGFKPLRIRGNRLEYAGKASDGGDLKAGKIEIRGRFTKRAKVASGTLLIRGAKALGVGGEVENCHTGRGAKPKPLKWRLVGAI